MNFNESSNDSLSDSGGDFPVRVPNMRRSTSDRHLPVREQSSPVFRPTSTPVDKLLFSEDEAGIVREIYTTAHEDAATANSFKARLVDATDDAGPRPCARAGRHPFASGPCGDERVFQQGEDLAPSRKVRRFNAVASSSSSSSSGSDKKSRPVRPQPTTTTLTIDSSSVNSKELQRTSSLGSETVIGRAHGTGSSLAADLDNGSFSSVSPSASAVVQSAIEARESAAPSTEEMVSLPAHAPNRFADRFSLSHNSATFDLSPKVDAIAATASQALGTGGNQSFAEEVEAHDDAASAIPLESEEKWSQLLAQSTRLASAASLTATHATAVGMEEDGDVEEGLLKVMTVLQIVNDASHKLERPLLQNYVRRMAHDMISTQTTLADAGLMPYVGCSHPEAVLSRGVFELHVDSSCRLFAVLDVEQCTVSLRDILAFHITPLTEQELVAVIKVTTRRLAALHAAGFVHGALHVGNILFSTVDGHCTLTQPMGVAGNLLFPADMSSLSPNRARRLAPHVQRVWGPNAGRQVGRLGNPQPVDAGEQLAAFILGLLSEEEESAGELPAQFGGMPITPADDIFALGALTVSLLLGLPVFYGSTLHETVEVLSGTPTLVNGSTNGEEVDTGTRFFLKEIHGPYAQLRFHQAGYSETFIGALSAFVADCLRSGCLSDDVGSLPEAIYVNADALLAHPLFTEFFPEDENEDFAQDTLHRVAYPVGIGLQNAATQCGTTPYVAQLHANSIFSSRRSALADDYNSQQRSCAAELHGDLTSAQWPLLNRRCSDWLPLCPSVTSCDPSTYRDTTANLHSVGETGWGFWFPFHAQPRSLRCAGIPNSMQQEAVELKCDCRIVPHLHTILFDNRVNATLLMGNADVAPWREAVDILVLRNLTSCRIQILTHFRYVVMHNLRGCEVLLGPCHAALIQSVEDCSPIALAGTYLLLDDVSRVHLQFSGSSRPTMALGREYTVQEIDLEPYGVVYPGQSMDYSAVALPQEHAAVFHAPNTTATSVALQRPVKLLEMEPQTHDVPYSHALPAFGYCFMHCDDNESDVYMYYGELHGKDAHILNIHGGGDQPPHAESHLYSTDTQLSARHLGSDGQRHCSFDAEDSPITSNPRYPVIFILDAIQDVIVRNCSYCTVFVLGATGSVVVEHCHNMRIFFMAKEATVEDCFAVTIFAFVTEYMLVANSFYMDIWPLYVKCPYVDAILYAIVDGCTVEDTEDGETVRQAYETRRMNLLNVVLQEGGRQVITTECNDTLVLHDTAWFRENKSEKPYMISIAVPAVELESTTVPEGYAGTCVSECTFFESCCSAMGISIEGDFRHVRFGDLLYSPTTDMEATQLLRDTDVVGPRAMTIVRIHDLLDTSVLRILGALHLRPDSQVTGRGVPETADAAMRLEVAADLILERLVLGEAHFVEAVGCLIIRNCAGPLDIAVCAAKRVVMEGCTNVVLRTACISFSARDCHNCHVALHVNTPPCYLRCSGMVTSALNLAAHSMEWLLSCVGVRLDLNAFEKILLLPTRAADVGDSSAECVDDHGEPTLHSYCAGTREDSSDPHGEPPTSGGAHAQYDTSTKMPLWESPPITNMMEAFKVLRRPVTVVPPLDHMVIGLEDAESIEKLEHRVRRDESRMPLEEQLMAALSYVVTANFQTHEVNATQYSQELPALQQTCAKDEDLRPTSNKARESHSHTPTEWEVHQPPHRFIPAPAPSSLEISENPVIVTEASGVESSEDDGPAIPMQMAVPREAHVEKSAPPSSSPPFIESAMTGGEVPAVSLAGPRRTPLEPPVPTPTKVAGPHDQEDHPLSRQTSAVSSASVENGTGAVQPAAGFGSSVLPQALSPHPTFSLPAPPVPTGDSSPKAPDHDLGRDYSSEDDSRSASGAKASRDALVTTGRSGSSDVVERDPSFPTSVPQSPINTSVTPVKGYPVQATDTSESCTLNEGQASTPRSCREEEEEEEKKLKATGTAERSASATVGVNPPLELWHHMDPTAGPTASADTAVQVSEAQPPTSFAVRELREILRATRRAYVPLTSEGEQQLAEQVAKAITKVKLWAAGS